MGGSTNQDGAAGCFELPIRSVVQIDDTDVAIVEMLQADGRIPASELGRRIGFNGHRDAVVGAAGTTCARVTLPEAPAAANARPRRMSRRFTNELPSRQGGRVSVSEAKVDAADRKFKAPRSAVLIRGTTRV